jgi:UDP-N-acetylmuramoyl-tripeptide--D-alanyl-D-alanine ligase
MFKVAELIKATGGKLICGRPDTQVDSISTDSRSRKMRGAAFLALRGANFDGHDFIRAAINQGAGLIIAEASASHLGPRHRKVAFIEVRDTLRALGDIARFHRQKFKLPVIAVTGTNGKTTTKEMIAWVLSGQLKVLKNEGTKNNQIGLPQTLLKLDSSYDLAVLEIGTNHFGEVAYLADIASVNLAVITNIGPAHLEYFQTLEGVFQEKTSLLKRLLFPAIAILNSDDKYLRRVLVKGRPRPVTFGFGLEKRADFSASLVKRLGERIYFLLNQKYKFSLATIGYFNVYNALAAVAVGRIFGLGYIDLIPRIEDFVFPQNRLRLLKLNNTRLINDTYNSNPLSLRSALDTLANFQVKGRKILVMGDMLELGNAGVLFHRRAGLQAARACDLFISVGKLAKSAAESAWRNGLKKKNIFSCNSNQEASHILYQEISPGPDDIVLIKGSRAMKLEELLDYRLAR